MTDSHDLFTCILMLLYGICSLILLQYCSDPVSLAVADAVLTVIEEELQANAKEVGDYLMERLRALVDKYDCLGDVRYEIEFK